jgi:hypothetical protein
MKPTVTASGAQRSSRLLIVLAAVWMAVSLTIGGALTADPRAEATDTTPITRSAAQP